MSGRRVLMIYQRFPPFQGSGSFRPFHFAKHLPECGWSPTVISLEPRPGDPIDFAPLEELPPECELVRVTMDLTGPVQAVKRRLEALFGRPIGVAGTPGEAATRSEQAPRARHGRLRTLYHTLRWAYFWHLEWSLPVLRAAEDTRPPEGYDLVWATAPRSVNALAGWFVSRALGVPLVLDLRDPWTYGSIWKPLTPLAAWIERSWARFILRSAAATVFTSPLTRDEMARRFPRAADHMVTITNGYAEGPALEPKRAARDDAFVLSYCGSLNERRRPHVLLEAFRRAMDSDLDFARRARLQFVGGLGPHGGVPAQAGVADHVDDVGRVGNAESLAYMRGADVNLLLQTIRTGEDVIGGKAFEYLAAGRPILAAVSPTGGDAWLLRETGAGVVVDFDDPDGLCEAYLREFERWKNGWKPEAQPEARHACFSRRALTRELATLLDRALG